MLARLLIIAALALSHASAAQAASIVSIATLGEAAPGGGVFAGPGFLGRPSAAGDGWVAFRSLVAGGASGEEIVLANMNPARSTRLSAARAGQQVSEALGSIDDFIGNPSVNGTGDVAFIATLNPPEDPPAGEPEPAALLLYDVGSDTLQVLAVAGTDTPLGPLGLAEGLGGSSPTLDGRTPSLTDDGDVAFTALGIGDVSDTEAIFLLQGAALTVVTQTGTPLEGGTIASLGTPALSALDHVAFRATIEGGPIADAVVLWSNPGLTTVAADGDVVTTTEPSNTDQTLEEFGAVVDLADDDTVAFVAGPLVDFTNGPDSTDSGFGVLRWSGGAPELLAFPGQTFGTRGRVTDVRLLPEFGSAIAPPHLTASGDVLLHAELNGGSSAAIARASTPGGPFVEIAVAGGGTPTPTPLGGTFSTFLLPPTIDDEGVTVAIARLSGAPVSAGLFYRPDGTPFQAIVVGEPSPGTDGFLGGASFASTRLNDAGDVAFRSTIFSGPSPIAIFRWRRGEATPLVRAGDAAPVAGDLPFTDLVGQHDLNDDGVVAFAGLVEGLGRGVYIADTAVVTRIAAEGDPLRILTGIQATFDSVQPNPAIADDAGVAFRGRVEYQDPDTNSTVRRDGIFLRAGNQIRSVVLAGDPSPAGEPFFRFRDLDVASNGRVAFVADIGADDAERRGLFLATTDDLEAILVEGDDLGGSVNGFTGGPRINDRGTVTQLARVATVDGNQTIVTRSTPGGLDVVARVGSESPAGGVYRSLGRPALSTDDTLAFRVTFESGTGGARGIFSANEADIAPSIGIGDPGPAPIGGQFTAFNQRLDVNREGAIAFIGTLGGGSVRSGVFVGQPTELLVQRFRMRVGTANKTDRIKMKLRLVSGALAPLFDLENSRFRITIRDDLGASWSETLAPGSLRKRGRAFTYTRKPTIPKIKVKRVKGGDVRATVRANPDITGGGLFPLQPPLSIDLEVADVSGQAMINCIVGTKRVRCR